MKKDILLIFPPLTEARLFPYLSLPMLTSFLKANSIDVAQKDLNIDLAHSLFTSNNLLNYIENNKSKQSLRFIYRNELAKYLLKYKDEIDNLVFNKEPDNHVNDKSSRAVRFAKNGVELLLEDSILKKDFFTVEDMIEEAQNFTTNNDNDFGVRQLYTLTKQYVEDNKPKVVGFSIAYYSQIFPSIIIAKWIKELAPSTFIIFGGQQIMLRSNQIYKQSSTVFVDALGTSAGEETLVKLVQYIYGQAEQSEVPDILWVDNKLSAQSSQSPKSSYKITDAKVPDFSGLPYKKYLSEEIHFSLITCIGCYWGKCIFCSYGNRSRKNSSYQQKTAEQIAKECEAIINTYGVHRINFVDENTNLKLVVKAVQLLNKKGVYIKFSTRNRLEDLLLDKAFCQELKRLGCILMSCGYETNSQRILDLLNKGVNSANYQQIIDNLDEAGIPLRLSLMGGLPDETPEEVKESELFLRKNASKIGIDVMQMLVAEPNTFLTDDPMKYKLYVNKDKRELRGNKLLNYGMGRMGSHFEYTDGDTFDPRLNRFIEMFNNINPQKNDEIPPQKRGADKSLTKTELSINPWVVFHSTQEGWVVLDLLWEKIYIIPYKGSEQEFLTLIHSNQINKIKKFFIDNGLVNSNMH
ncbi:B12-binding domain-containing radical SAM protein [Paenibacillus sp. GCM10012307]|uniref:B12-binding domain-containing radical SAM protein n=1 Tax=Paenibacillus roseus TaxID=2798579 RepID=A0A934J5F4_9BACL|nr:radical SAM protein [Paenibacillus roseus]MBJ6363195.1 B12-binding domain-containing radical SAM protein [Paenibacillus roseus]